MTHGINLGFDSCNRHRQFDELDNQERKMYEQVGTRDEFTPVPIQGWMDPDLVRWVEMRNQEKAEAREVRDRANRVRFVDDEAIVEALGEDLGDGRTGGATVADPLAAMTMPAPIEHLNGHAHTNGHRAAGDLAVGIVVGERPPTPVTV